MHCLCVASTMSPHWEYPTHRDVSVLWWKSYLKNVKREYTEDETHTTIERIFRKVQEEEIVGLNVNKSWFENSQIHLGTIPDEFKSDLNIIKCLNYPNSDDPRCRDFHTNSMDMFGFVQICS